MKIFTRIFFFTVLVVTIAMSLVSFILISSSFENAKKVEITRAQDEYNMLRAAFITGLYSSGKIENSTLTLLIGKMQRLASDGSSVLLMDNNRNTYSGTQVSGDIILSDENKDFSEIKRIDGQYMVFTQSTFNYDGASYSFATTHSIQNVFDETQKLCNTYIKLYMVMFFAALILMLVLAFMISRPIGKLSRATEKIAGGSYSERVMIESDDEIGALAANFNIMADEVEMHIEKLKDEARRREEFTAAFAHELKTPLTSVIGYADMICNGGISDSDVRQSAEFIRNEGLRLESLSHKMMELTVAGKQSFTLLEMSVSDCMADLEDTMTEVLKKYDAKLTFQTDEAYVKIEPDLFKTLMINLIDNSLKADAKEIVVTGRAEGDRYYLKIADNGRGIPSDELSKITEAFYMIDKSRSRKQHGAGLGLAIAQAIAHVHGTEPEFESEEGVGTSVCFSLEMVVICE